MGERMKNEWMNQLPPKFHLEGSISRCLVTSRGEEFHLSSLSEAKVSVESQKDERMKNEWMNQLPPKFHLEGSISRCLVTSRGEEFHLSSLSEAKDSVESRKDEKMRNEWEGDEWTPCFRCSWPEN